MPEYNIDKTPEEIQEFISAQELSLPELESPNSITTNYTITKNNFIRDQNFDNYVASFVKYLLVNQSEGQTAINIIKTLQQQKTKLTFNGQSVAIGNSTTITIGDDTYRLHRLSEYAVRITMDSDPDWNPDNICVICKDSNHVQIYPVVTTSSTNIEIYSETAWTTEIIMYLI